MASPEVEGHHTPTPPAAAARSSLTPPISSRKSVPGSSSKSRKKPKIVQEEVDELDEDDEPATSVDGGGKEFEEEVEEDENGKFECGWEDCGKKYAEQSGMVKHVLKAHIGASQTKYACEWIGCKRKGEKQTTRHSLITHVRGHTGERPYVCPHDCGKTFTRSDALSKHVRSVHTPSSNGVPHKVSRNLKPILPSVLPLSRAPLGTTDSLAPSRATSIDPIAPSPTPSHTLQKENTEISINDSAVDKEMEGQVKTEIPAQVVPKKREKSGNSDKSKKGKKAAKQPLLKRSTTPLEPPPFTHLPMYGYASRQILPNGTPTDNIASSSKLPNNTANGVSGVGGDVDDEEEIEFGTDIDLITDPDLKDVLTRLRDREPLRWTIEELRAAGHTRLKFSRKEHPVLVPISSLKKSAKPLEPSRGPKKVVTGQEEGKVWKWTHELDSDDSFDEGVNERFIGNDKVEIGKIGESGKKGEKSVYGRSKWSVKYIMSKAKLMLVEEENRMRKEELREAMERERQWETMTWVAGQK